MTGHVFFLFPETAGKPLEEVTEMFECYDDTTNKNETTNNETKRRGGRGGRGIKYVGIPAWRTKSEFGRQMRRERGEVEVEMEEELGDGEKGEKGELERREVVRFGGKEGEV